MSSPAPDSKESRREKHRKRMNKILFKAWSLPSSAPFQEPSHKHKSANNVGDLTEVGENLDKGLYEHGRSGWEAYARDMGRVYNGHLVRKSKHASTAKEHLDKVAGFFSKIDPILGDIVLKSKPSDATSTSNDATSNQSSKRKLSELDETQGNSSKKKANVGSNNGHLTLSQREQKGIDSLASYLEERGGERSQSDLFRCKAIQRPGGRYNTIFFSAENKRFRSMAEIARFLNLDERPMSNGNSKNNSKGKAAAKLKNHRATPKESERKRLKRELDKLHKVQAKAAKLLEAHKNDTLATNVPLIDYSLLDDGSNAAQAHREGKIIPPSDVEAFPGIPTYCVPDMLMVWDFLCTFCRTLSLEPIELDDFAAALSYRPPENGDSPVPVSGESDSSSPSTSNIPVYLSESHIALLRLLLQDPTSDTWWWSILETPEMIEEEDNEYLNAVDRKRKTAAAVVKIDMEGLLNVDEDPEVTTKWLQALDDIRIKKPDNSSAIKSIVKSAISITTNHLVKAYLKKAMRKWRAKSAGLVKRAVVWLIDKVREARPDLWGRSINVEDLVEQKKCVVADANIEMERVVEDADDDAADDNLEGSDDESDEDEDESDNEDEYADQAELPVSPSKQICSIAPKENDDITPVTTFVPNKPVPSLVDLLLPPGKPPVPSDLVHALTWPPVIGATGLRVLQWYKRRRNEVDDSIREFRELRPMSVAERRRRESSASLRILSECGHQTNGKVHNVESAIHHLCDGKDYLTLTVVQRLCIFRILIEAAYDTQHVQQHIEDNFKSRMNAVKALDAEERRAKKEAREDQAAIEAAARERLAKEAREAFIERKRQEVMECIGGTDLTEEDVESMEDDELIEFDEETKAEYEALPTPESFNKVEINAAVAKIQEETVFGTDVLSVITRDEVEQKDVQYLKSLEDELETIASSSSNHRSSAERREMSSRSDRIRKEITYITEHSEALFEDRKIAMELLKDAIEDGTIKTLRVAIKTAEQARLSDDDLETGGIWAVDLLRDAKLELRNAESRKRVVEAQKDLIAKRNKCFIRTDPLGKDRYQSSFIHFDHDLGNRIWAERDLILAKDGYKTSEGAPLLSDPTLASICAPDEQLDFLTQDERDQSYGETFLAFARKEYHPSAKIATLSMHHWSCYTTDNSLRFLVKNLSGRCPQEKELKEALKETLETMALAAGEKNAQVEDASSEKKDVTEFLSSGDEAAFGMAKRDAIGEEINILENLSSAIGTRTRLRRILDPDRAPDFAQYKMGTITGWKLDQSSEDVSPESPKAVAIWKVGLDDGGELYVAASELVESIIRAQKWSSQNSGYIEHDAPFLSYRNGLGRFCGRAVEAPSSMTSLAFAKHMIKKEQDLYMPFKNRAFENNWGGKSGARNAWVSSLKEHGHTFEAVRDGLLTLEEALFDLSGGFGTPKPTSDAFIDRLTNEPVKDVDLTVNNSESNGHSSIHDEIKVIPVESSKLAGKALLYDEVSRFDIELESIGNEVKGLWNNSDAREIFREIILSSTTVSILALGLDLISRNGKAWVNRTKSSTVSTSAAVSDNSAGIFLGRRRAAMQRPGAYSDFF